MRQSPRLLQGSNSRAGRSNGLEPTIAGSLPPTTPHHPKNGAALDSLIVSLENEWKLGLKIRDSHWSPQKTDEKSISDKVYGQIKRLHYGAKPELNAVLDNFRNVARNLPHEMRLEVLHGLLKSKTQSPISRAGTPLNEPLKGLKSVQPVSSQTSRPARLFDGYQRDEPGSYHTAVNDPGSPTNVDEDDYFTPPSPTRSQTSTRRQAGDGASSRASSRYNPRKRPSDSLNDSLSSPKLTKTSQGKQPVDTSPAPLAQQPIYPDLFKVPSLSMARSFQNHGNYNAPSSSVTTSFNNDSVFSSQQTQATQDTSANTSFMTDGANDEVIDGRKRRSSISLQSLADSEAIAAVTEAEKKAFELEKSRESDRVFSQEASWESNSTYDSADEDVLLHITSGAEEEPKPSSTPLKGVIGPAQPSMPAKVSAPPNVSALIPPPDPQAESNESPPRVAWYIRDLPKSNLFVDELPSSYTSFPYFLLFIACRVAVTNNVPLEDVLKNVDSTLALNSPELFWSKLGGHLRTSPRDSSAVWAAAKKNFEGYSFKGKVVFETSRSGPVLRLNLLPIESDLSCLLQRMFGSDRFLYLTFPSFQENKPDRFTREQMPLIEAQWKLWRSSTHTFLGRKWRVFFVEPVKKNGKVRKITENAADVRVVLFATEGLGIESPMQVGEMLNEFFDFARNEDQSYCKAFARIELALSKTIPTVAFKPSQIRRVADTRADGTPECCVFNDLSLDFSKKGEPDPVMNDGCARISVGAAQLLWSQYRSVTGSDEPLPSSFQGRIGCAKGMWMISSEPHTQDPYHLGVWIEINDSQQKARPKYEDEDDNRPYNSHRLTFNYVKHSFVNGSSDLHIAYIPILVDRGVPRDVIANLMKCRLDQERTQLMEMLDDPVRLHNWITKQGSATPALGILPWQAALPAMVPEKAKLLLRTGFTPSESPFLARLLKTLVKQRQLRVEEKLKVPLGKTTYLLGLADPEGVLKPGEVHVQFSKPFLDEYNRSTYRSLAGEEVLVSRQPACRRSDIQKMRAVAHPRLSHLVDVIVFPSLGEYPAAGKLQGGDYDGDTFWVCWEPPLVTPFKNTPAPLEALNPQDYGIIQDNKKIKDVMNPYDLSTVDNFVERALNFRDLASLLGKATVFAEKVAYYENRIYSETLNALYAVHDLLVDATKQAYRFTDEMFNRLVRVQLRCGNPQKPAYKQAMEANIKFKAPCEEDKGTEKELRHNPHNVLDFLYFDVVRKHNRETRQALEAALSNEEYKDPDLQEPFLQLYGKNDDVLTVELDNLLKNIKEVVRHWNRSLGDKSELSPDRYNKLLDACYTAFRSLMPNPANESHPQIAPLLYSYLGSKHPTTWETIRSSALYTANPKKHSLVWHMAGRELARLKAGTNMDTYNVVPSVFADLKTKPAKVFKPEDGENESDDEFESAIQH